jgi:cyclic pyranopterin phosphate synthase
VRDLALTTNGVLFAEQGEALHAAGLHRVTVSLDSLRPERFAALTGRDTHAQVLEGIAAARRLDFPKLKLDTVVLRGVNEDELADLIEYGRSVDAEVRFIEYMDVGGATQWSIDAVVSRRDILARLAERYGAIEALGGRDSAPAERFRLPDGTTFGIIASTTEPFCAACDRSRLTADGLWLLCLYARGGLDLRHPLREGATREELAHLISTVWSMRADRGAEERLGASARDVLIPVATLKRDAHLEMHTRGG